MVRRVTVCLPDELAERLDAEATTLGVSRSELVQEASASYLAKTAEERHADAKRRERLEALEGMRRLAQGWGPDRDPRPSWIQIREDRDFDHAAPPLGSPERAEWEERVGYREWLSRLEAAGQLEPLE